MFKIIINSLLKHENNSFFIFNIGGKNYIQDSNYKYFRYILIIYKKGNSKINK
jgi:hypothetical protein